MDAQGIIEIDEGYEIIPAKEGTVTVSEEEVSISSPVKANGPRKVSGTKKLQKKITISDTFKLCDEASISYTVKMTNPVIKYNVSAFNHSAFVTFDSDATISYSAKFDMAKAIPKDRLLLFTVNVCGIGSFDVLIEVELSATVNGTQKGHLKGGISYDEYCGFRLERNFECSVSSLEADATGSVGLSFNLGVTDLPVLNAYVYANIGAKANLHIVDYVDGLKPEECADFYAYLYANIGARASISFANYTKSANPSYVIWNEKTAL